MNNFNNLIAGATFLKMKLDFKKNVLSLEENKIELLSNDGDIKVLRCYSAKYNPTTNSVITDSVGDEDYSVLYFPQKNNENVIMVPRLSGSEVDLNDVTKGIITKWRYES